MRINDTLCLSTTSVPNFGASGSFGTAATTVDIASSIAVPQTTSGGISVTLPAPTVAVAGQMLSIPNTGTQPITVDGISIAPSTTALFLWNGTKWAPSAVPLTTSTFVDVRGAANQVIGNTFSTVIMGIVASNAGGYYNATTGIYTVPVSGIYQITGTLRTLDGSAAGTQFGVGVHTSNSDGGWFLWHAVQNTTNATYRRTTYPYIRVGRFNAGDQLRMFSYCDSSVQLLSAAMQIMWIGN